MLREISPPAFAYASRCQASEIRHWRCEGLIDGIGERIGKGHLYSAAEAAFIAIGAVVARHGFGYREAFAIISDRRSQVDELMKATLRGDGCSSDYVLTFALNFDVQRGYQSITAAPIGQCKLDRTIPGALQVNVSAIIRDVVDRLRFYERHLGGSDLSDAA